MNTDAYHALCEHGNVLCGVVRQTLDQAAEFRRGRHCERHRLVPPDVTDIISDGLKLLVSNWGHRTCTSMRDRVF